MITTLQLKKLRRSYHMLDLSDGSVASLTEYYYYNIRTLDANKKQANSQNEDRLHSRHLNKNSDYSQRYILLFFHQ